MSSHLIHAGAMAQALSHLSRSRSNAADREGEAQQKRAILQQALARAQALDAALPPADTTLRAPKPRI